jgi:hypothetical protein
MPDGTDTSRCYDYVEINTHFPCILSTILDCMDGSQIYCCSKCLVEQVKDWADEWLASTHEHEEEE